MYSNWQTRPKWIWRCLRRVAFIDRGIRKDNKSYVLFTKYILATVINKNVARQIASNEIVRVCVLWDFNSSKWSFLDTYAICMWYEHSKELKHVIIIFHLRKFHFGSLILTMDFTVQGYARNTHRYINSWLTVVTIATRCTIPGQSE